MAIFGRRSNDAAQQDVIDEPGLPTPEGLRARGPWDRSEVEAIGQRLDLGGLWLGGMQGMRIQLELEPGTDRVIGVNCQVEESGLQLQAYAAPRSSGIWREIRMGIADAIEAQGGSTELAEGPLGDELHTRMPVAGDNGQITWAPVRFVGVDGPRWFLRAVMSGPAAVEEAAAAPLYDLVRDVVVVRGDEAMPPRELIPLILPRTSAAGEPGAVAVPVES